jgi:nicotinamidase-related amidase
MSDAAEPFLDPATTALVLIDLQQFQHSSAPYSPEQIVARAEELVAAVRAAGGLVVFVRTSWLPDDSDRLAPRIDAPRPPRTTRPPGWDELVPELQPLDTEPIVTKRSFNAFHGSDLDLQLRRHGIRTVILGGISTNYGVEGTGRSAFDHGYEVVFVSDAMASPDEEGHFHSLSHIMPLLGRVRPMDEVLAALRVDAGVGPAR